MTKLPLKLKGVKGDWSVLDASGKEEASGYGSKAEAEEARQGLTRFYAAHPKYQSDNPEDWGK